MVHLLSYLGSILGIILLVIISGCTSTPSESMPRLPKPLRNPTQISPTEATFSITETSTTQEESRQTRFQNLPQPPTPDATTSAQLDEVDLLPRFTKTAPVSVNIEGLPLAAFINEVFGNLLGLSFEMDSKVQRKKELVTLRVTEPQPPQQLYNLAQQVLTNYGIAIEMQGNFLRFIVERKREQGQLPSLITQGLALPEVPPSHRPVFQFIPLKVVNYNQIQKWIEQIYKGYDIEIQGDNRLNAIVLIGPPQLVKQAAKAVRLFDQPLLKSKYSMRIEPAFLSAKTLTQKLTQILTSQGYSISETPTLSSITALPIEETNIIIVFAPDQHMLSYVQQWAKQLDQPNLTQPTEEGKWQLFFYPVKNTKAENIANLINTLIKNNRKPKQPGVVSQFLVDPHRNALLFNGTQEEWVQLLPILKNMDKPTKQVLIEATIAEITLTEQDQRGIEWILNKADLGGLDGSIGTLGTLGVGSSGLTYTLSSAAQVRAILNVFASNSRATLLSTPRLMVRSGTQATINVGTEIPTLTSQTTSDLQQDGTSALLQQIQYRRTGLILTITPTVYAGRQIDLAISQQISEARPNATSNINSPEISNRQISTELSLADGHSVLLGGLISNSHSEGRSGVPFLSDIPLVGQLFRVDKTSDTRTELVIMIIPYIIDNELEAQAITETLQRQLEWLPSNDVETAKSDTTINP